jgi:hypothetical protein
MDALDDLLTHGTGIAPLGDAPDGLPLRLLVNRGLSRDELLAPIARQLGYERQMNLDGWPLETLAVELGRLLRQRDVQAIDTVRGPIECYVTAQPVARILGPTVLQRLLGDSFLTMPGSAFSTDTRSRPPSPAAATIPGPFPPPAPPAQDRPVKAEIGTGRLALPLDGSNPIVVRRIERPNQAPLFRAAHEYEPERLGAFPSARFRSQQPLSGEFPNGQMRDTAAYRKARRRQLESQAYGTFVCSVDKQDIVQRIPELAWELWLLHQRGEIHGDVKPANLLITGKGVLVIDSLDLRPAQLAPALTPVWAAPEQIIGQPVDYRTDQYPLGMLLCRLIEGVMYGEEATYLVPTGGGRRERFMVLRNAGVYIEPGRSPIAEEGIRPWQQILDRCLRFDLAQRYNTITEMADAVREVSERYPVEGKFEIDLSFGELVATPDHESGFCWQSRDTR